MACPSDKNELKLNINNSDWISEGEFICTECGKSYEIREGIPYFFEKGNGFEWNSLDDKEIVKSIVETISDRSISWSKVIGLGPLFLNRVKDRKKAIDSIFSVVVEATKSSNNVWEETYLMQAATAARYDIENYRGTFKLSKNSIKVLKRNYKRNLGIIVEGACATGECLSEISKKIKSNFYLGYDISGAMVRYAQKNSKDNMLFVQGDVSSPPIKRDSVGIYVLNNVFDRVEIPSKASDEADEILNKERSFFVLSNCDPLQFGYTTEDGREILFVSELNQIESLEGGLVRANFREIAMEEGMWDIETAAYGKESLPYKSLIGKRKRYRGEDPKCYLDFTEATRLVAKSKIKPEIEVKAGISFICSGGSGKVSFGCYGPDELCDRCNYNKSGGR